ncbi:hypothetical protein [Nocardiopsis protaetiae]|uniref:hypothetical protein n=1 Tax=Nocardiopsis protaetiae TaxID=3382270 RepID=UPI00387B004F
MIPSSPPPADFHLTAEYALLHEWEIRWRPKVNKADRVFELDLLPTVDPSVPRALGRVFSWNLTEKKEPAELWPACTILTTVKAAADGYHEGSFWGDLWKLLDIPEAHRRSHRGQQVWGERFLRALRLTGLDRDTGRTGGSGKKYVGAALLHAGVPVYCLDDLFDLLLEWRTRHPRSGVEGFLDWFDGLGSRVGSLDVPVRLFLKESRDPARGTLERCVRILDRVMSDPSAEAAPSTDDPSGHLGSAAVKAVIRAQSRENRPAPQEPKGTPRLWLAPSDARLRLQPPPGWTMAPGQEEVVAPGEDEHAHPSMTLTRPVPRVRLVPPGTSAPAEVPIINEDDPVLVFTRQGRHIAHAKGITPRTLWLLHPADALEVSAKATVLVREDLSAHWHGWQLSQVEFPPGSRFRSGPGPFHLIASASAPDPVLSRETVLPGVTDRTGAPVHSERPTVTAPPGEGPAWTLDVFIEGEGRSPLTSRPLPAGEAADPWAGIPVLQAGSFILRAHCSGRQGRKWERRVVLVEGLAVAHTPWSRLPLEHGWEPGESRISVSQGAWFRPSAAKVRYGAHDEVAEVTVIGGPRRIPIRVEAPRFEIRLTTRGGDAVRSPAGTALTPEEVRTSGDLEVRSSLGGDPGDLLLRLRSDEGDLIQQESPRVRGDAARFPLPRFADMAHAHQQAFLELCSGGRSHTIARIRPEPLADEAVFDDDDAIRFNGLSPNRAFLAALYQENAPWRPPVVFPVRDGRIPMDHHFEIGGPVRILLREDDPWAAAPEFPPWPRSSDGTLLRCLMPGRPNSGDDAAEDRLCAYLNGRSTVSPDDELVGGANRSRIWETVARQSLLTDPEMLPRLSRLVQKATDPEEGLDGHAGIAFGPVFAVWALISCGGVSTMPKGADEDRLLSLWRHNPVAAALSSRHVIRASGPEAAVPTAVVRRCGEQARTLLRGVPRSLVENPDESRTAPQVRDILATLRWEPRARLGLLDPAVEQTAVERTRQADGARARELAARGKGVFQEVHSLCERAGISEGKVLSQLLAVRNQTCSRQDHHLPALSLALAVNARSAARAGTPRNHERLDRIHRPLWADLALLLPELVALDIVLAELTLTGLDRARWQ